MLRGFVLMRHRDGDKKRDGAYVARVSSVGGSYTRRLENAAIYRTREEADKARCPENEDIVSVDDLVDPWGRL